MEFKFIDEKTTHPLIDHFYQLKISKSDLPFKTLIVPPVQTTVTYVFCDDYQLSERGKNKILYKDLTLTGIMYGVYYVSITNESENLGFSLRSTALYKILGKDISSYNNSHINFKEIDKDLNDKLCNLFKKNRTNIDVFVSEIYNLLDKYPLTENKFTKFIDNAINYIKKKDGLLSVNDLLEVVPLSQKSLESHFKKIIGITPGKYIRQHRFLTLMKKYQSKKIELTDLIHQFNYYDASHFGRDFKLFMGQTPRQYFQKDYPLIKKYLIE